MARLEDWVKSKWEKNRDTVNCKTFLFDMNFSHHDSFSRCFLPVINHLQPCFFPEEVYTDDIKSWTLTTMLWLFRFQGGVRCSTAENLAAQLKATYRFCKQQIKINLPWNFSTGHCTLTIVNSYMHIYKYSRRQHYEKSTLHKEILQPLPARGGRYVLQSLEGRLFI